MDELGVDLYLYIKHYITCTLLPTIYIYIYNVITW